MLPRFEGAKQLQSVSRLLEIFQRAWCLPQTLRAKVNASLGKLKYFVLVFAHLDLLNTLLTLEHPEHNPSKPL